MERATFEADTIQEVLFSAFDLYLENLHDDENLPEGEAIERAINDITNYAYELQIKI